MLAITVPRALKSRNIQSFLTIIVCLSAGTAFATTGQQPSALQLREYNAAIAQKQPADRIRELQQFAWTTSGPLRTDALEVIVWEYLRAGNNTRALTWANELNLADKGNALALAVICQDAQRSPRPGVKPDQVRRTANQALNALPHLRHPAGMSDADFVAMRRQASLLLGKVAGQTAAPTRNSSVARSDSHRATPTDSTSAQRMYQSAIADLSGKNPNRKQGFWELARAVVLSGDSVQGRKMAQEARGRYLQDGGTNAGWNQFLEAAAAGNPSLAPSARFASARPASTLTASSVPASKPSKTSSASLSKSNQHLHTASIKPATVSTTATRKPDQPRLNAGEQVWPDSRTASPGIVHGHRVTTGPMSLGILIETSLTSAGRRGAVANTLTDMLRHMNDDDEAFILSYDNNMVLEEDLTNDPDQLDRAMKGIRSGSGAKLDEALATAAGHLARIAKNPNRILLVISDGKNVDGQASPVRTSGLINAAGVRIYCIGIGVDRLDGRSHLQALSAGTGGRTDFISDSSQFRGATRQIAQNIGIDFRF